MKRLKRNPAKFETLALFSAIARDEAISFGDDEACRELMNNLDTQFFKAKSSSATMHGLRTQMMFECLVAALGKCAVLKREDAKEIWATDTSLEPPDLRLLLDDGQELLVEVKNYYQSNPRAPYRLAPRYFNGLSRYARLFSRDLKIAIYWAKWNTWTLVPEAKMKGGGRLFSISMPEAMTANEMSILGDCMVGTKPPLRMKLLADKRKPRSLSDDGKIRFTIGGFEIYCGDTRIDDSFEKQIAFYLMLFGDWAVVEPTCESEGNQPLAVQYTCHPEKRTPGQGFEIVGSLSGMFSRYYNLLTAPCGKVERPEPSQDPSSMGVTIPDDYDGKYLPLWRFTLEPSGCNSPSRRPPP